MTTWGNNADQMFKFSFWIITWLRPNGKECPPELNYGNSLSIWWLQYNISNDIFKFQLLQKILLSASFFSFNFEINSTTSKGGKKVEAYNLLGINSLNQAENNKNINYNNSASTMYQPLCSARFIQYFTQCSNNLIRLSTVILSIFLCGS